MTTSLHNIPINTLSGEPTSLGAYEGHALLVV
ncbi:glutathione peroxidase, partial [Rhodococcus sp. CC-R104]|nr:glutathione peroxidase [Rhodococcus sp. CC-R104]